MSTLTQGCSDQHLLETLHVFISLLKKLFCYCCACDWLFDWWASESAQCCILSIFCPVVFYLLQNILSRWRQSGQKNNKMYLSLTLLPRFYYTLVQKWVHNGTNGFFEDVIKLILSKDYTSLHSQTTVMSWEVRQYVFRYFIGIWKCK